MERLFGGGGGGGGGDEEGATLLEKLAHIVAIF